MSICENVQRCAGFFVLALLASISAEAAIPPLQRAALEALYNQTSGPSWLNHSGWLDVPGTECRWFGVACANGSTIVKIDLSSNNLSGVIPAEIAALVDLTSLELDRNELRGAIPSQLGTLTKLQQIYLQVNRLSGEIPPSLGNLRSLTDLYLSDNQLTGGIPGKLGELSELEDLFLNQNRLTGSIPAELARLRKLKLLRLNDNQLTGSIPSELTTVASLVDLGLGINRLTGTIPQDIGNLQNLTVLSLSVNQLTGEIPPGVTRLVKLRGLYLAMNHLEGRLPQDIGSLSDLTELSLHTNQLTGSIPPGLGRLGKLKILRLASNRFSGSIPSEIGALTALTDLGLHANQLAGRLPSTLVQLVNLTPGKLNLSHNGFHSNDPALRDFLNQKQGDGDWERTQTVTPLDLKKTFESSTAVVLNWTGIRYTGGLGGYEIGLATSSGGPYITRTTTATKSIVTRIVDDLQPNTTYFFSIRAVSYPFGTVNSLGRPYQQNVVSSEFAPEVVAVTTGATASPAEVVVVKFPTGIVQRPGQGGNTDSFILTNVGRAATNITLTKSGDSFFSQSPASFSLAAGSSQIITITADPRSAGLYEGASLPAGDGLPAGLSIPIRLLVADITTGNIIAEPVLIRIDVSGPLGVNPSGTVSFRNQGNVALIGILASDAAWLVPKKNQIATIQPGTVGTLSFSVDRSMRPDALNSEGASGALGAGLFLIYPQTPAAARGILLPFDTGNPPPGVNTTRVSVVDTISAGSSFATLPPLSSSELALFIPGVGKVVGGSGTFLSDFTVLNAFGSTTIRDLRLYFTSLMTGASSVAQLPPLATTSGLRLADVTNGVFATPGTLGTLQIRGSSLDQVAVSATILNVQNVSGTQGSLIPVFRSDRSATSGQKIYLTGVRSDATTRTNLFLQDVAGVGAVASVEFLGASGRRIGSLLEVTLSPFGLAFRVQAVPAGAVSAIVTNASASASARIVAYATPVDVVSGDFWSVVDWSTYYGTRRSDPSLIPIVGSTQGNVSYFRTDVAVMNVGTKKESLKLRLHRSNREVLDRTHELAPNETRLFNDILKSEFDSLGLGYIEVTPVCETGDEAGDVCAAAFAVTSRTYATTSGIDGTYGSSTPTVPVQSALRLGQSLRIDVAEDTLPPGKPGTFRTNVGFVEAAGKPVTVRLSLSYWEARGLASALRTFSATIPLQANSFRGPESLSGLLFGPQRTSIRNAQILVEVVEGDGAVIFYTVANDNGTGDLILRTE